MLSEEEFLVPATDGKHVYRVVHLDSWTCSCPDFQNRCKQLGIYCKHIKALQQFLKLRNSVELEGLDINETMSSDEAFCPSCNSGKITKQGFRKNKNSVKQKYKCEDCQKFFVNEPIKHIKGNAKMV